MKKLATLVAVLAISVGVLVGCGGGSGASGTPVSAAITMDDALKFTPNTITANKGDALTVNLTGGASMAHDFVISELGIKQTVDPGKTASVKIPTDKPGTYTFFCSQPGHQGAGMQGTLTIK